MWRTPLPDDAFILADEHACVNCQHTLTSKDFFRWNNSWCVHGTEYFFGKYECPQCRHRSLAKNIAMTNDCLICATKATKQNAKPIPAAFADKKRSALIFYVHSIQCPGHWIHSEFCGETCGDCSLDYDCGSSAHCCCHCCCDND